MRILFVTALLLCGCLGTSYQATLATTVAVTANASLPMLVDAYQKEGVDAIHMATDRATAEKRLTEIEASWRPVWKSWDALSKAEDDWARLLESGGDGSQISDAVKKSYCDLMSVWPKSVPAKPISAFPCVTQ